jgi:hypothetical protein
MERGRGSWPADAAYAVSPAGAPRQNMEKSIEEAPGVRLLEVSNADKMREVRVNSR